MRFIDDILCLSGLLFISAAAFGVDWRLGMVSVGISCILTGIFVGKFMKAHPEVFAALAKKREEGDRKE